jgi:predicted O-linked N-acetylglucosamine transferase (SPINDLY family)
MPDAFDALHLLGVVEAQQGRLAEAHRLLDRALAINPRSAEAHSNRGNVLLALLRFEEACASYERALELRPDIAQTHYNHGSALRALARHEEALASYDRALALKPDFVEAMNNRGSLLRDLHRLADALASYDRALAMSPARADVLQNRGAVLSLLGRHEDAAKDLARALQLDPDLIPARGALLHSRMHCCDWRAYEGDSKRVVAEVAAGRHCATPFAFLGISHSAHDQLTCARTWVREQCPASSASIWKGERYRHDRIRLAYVSSDFHEHPMGHLMAKLFEGHDRSRFETIALSLGPDTADAMRSRMKGAFERFVDVRERSDREVAHLIRELEVDIAVDRTGFTIGARTGVFALRPAPVQVNYLAYPGTMGADYIDYIVADRVIIPPEHQTSYSEKIVYLPDSYQVNDSERRIAECTPARAAVGLPEHGFVFCSFNNTFKITPPVFGVWMRLLRKVEGSVLWLLEGNGTALGNLRREAESSGIAPERIVFAPRMRHEDHLARHRLADLFLDTLPCNAHTTASDALWVGLPVLTCMGTTFAGRVAASLLQAVGLPELVTRSLGDYEALALRLATDAMLLREIRQKVARNRETFPLFDTDRFRRHIEAAYVAMWEKYQRGEPPSPITVSAWDHRPTLR